MQSLATLSPQHPRNALHQQAPHHSVPFGHLPQQPGSLSHGFGLGPASSFGVSASWAAHASAPSSPAPSASISTSAFGASPSWRASLAWGGGATAARSSPPAAASPLPASRRRRRSASPESDDGRESMRVDNAGVESGPIAKLRGTKKARVGGSGGGDDRATALHHTLPVVSTDLGKALASLSKDSLLTIFTTLLTNQPALRPTIESLLPAPTLAATLSTLHSLERAVLAALPTGHLLREEYVWGRVRVSLDQYVAEAKSFLAAFCQPPSSAVATAEDEIGHPSTTFAFLHALTSSVRRLEVSLPSSPARNPLAGHLLPLTINAWHAFLTRLSSAVNDEGRVLSAGLVRGWFARIDELCVDSPLGAGKVEGGAKKACEGVRERMRRELGWLVGVRPTAGAVVPEMMEEEDEEL